MLSESSSELGDSQKSLSRDEADEQMNEASEALQHSEDKRKKAESRAQAAEKKMAKVEKKENASNGKLAKLESKEAASKKAAINAQAQVKKDKVQVKELKAKRETQFDRKGQEKGAKKGNQEKKAELKMMANQGKTEQKLEQEVTKDVSKLKLQKVLDANKMKMLKLQMELMKQEMQKKRRQDVEKLDEEIAKDRKQLKNTQRVGKAFSAYEGKNKAHITDSAKAAVNVMGSISGTVMVKQSQYKRLQASQKNEVKGQELMQDALTRLQKSDAKQKQMISKLKKKEASAEEEVQKLTKKHKAAMLTQKTKLRRELEKAHQKAAAAEAGSRSTLFMLHRSLAKRREGLESDIVGLRTRLKLESAGRKKLIEEYTQLNMEEQHLRAQNRIIDNVENIAKGMRKQYDSDIAEVGKSKQSIFIRNAKRKTLVGKFFLDVRALQKYLHRQIGIGNEKDKAKVIRYMEDTDKRHAVVLDDIAKQSAKAAHKLIDKQLAQDREALAGIDSPSAMVNTLEALKLKHAALKAEVTQMKKNKPSSNSVISGIYKSVKESTNPETVKRLNKRLDATLHTTKIATMASKKRADKSLKKAATRIFAHQIAHARNPAYLEMKKEKYAQWSSNMDTSQSKKEEQLEQLISEARPPMAVSGHQSSMHPSKEPRSEHAEERPKRDTEGKPIEDRPQNEAQKALKRIKTQPPSISKIMSSPVKPKKVLTKQVVNRVEKIDASKTMNNKEIQDAIKNDNTGAAMKKFMKSAEKPPTVNQAMRGGKKETNFRKAVKAEKTNLAAKGGKKTTPTKLSHSAKAKFAAKVVNEKKMLASRKAAKSQRSKEGRREGKRGEGAKEKAAMRPEAYAELGASIDEVTELDR